MSRMTDYIIDHMGEEHMEKGWLIPEAQLQANKHKFTKELSPMAKIAIANPTLVNNRTKEKLEAEFPEYPFPWNGWDGEDFN